MIAKTDHMAIKLQFAISRKEFFIRNYYVLRIYTLLVLNSNYYNVNKEPAEENSSLTVIN